jgi:YacP-like NYN domain
VPRPGDGLDPLAGVELVLIDGNNLLHALGPSSAGPSSGGPPMPQSAIIGRIRGAIPAGVRIELVFDGSPRGVTGRLATGMTVEYSRRATADQLIHDRLARQLAEGGPASTWPILVVTDDRELRDGARDRGARSAGTAWLLRRLAGTDRPVHGRPGATPVSRPTPGTTLGHGRSPQAPRPPDSPRTGSERRGPGRKRRSSRGGC